MVLPFVRLTFCLRACILKHGPAGEPGAIAGAGGEVATSAVAVFVAGRGVCLETRRKDLLSLSGFPLQNSIEYIRGYKGHIPD